MRTRYLSRLGCASALAGVCLAITSIGDQRLLPRAEAAFPGGNGHIAISVLAVGRDDLTIDGESIGDHDIFTIPPHGAGIRAVVTGPASDTQPSWSPDGSKLVFLRSDLLNGAVLGSDVFVVDSDGENLTRLTNTPAYFEYEPSWSPDGTQIVFSSDQATPARGWYKPAGFEPEQDIWVMDADGEDLRRITSNPGFESEPAWSPDGKWIAFQRDTHVAVVRPDGSGQRSLSAAGGGVSRAPSWSPDGRRVAFSSNGGIWVINVDGTGRRLIRRDGRRPSWSPDGTQIAFTSNRDGTWKLYKMASDGSRVTPLVEIDLRSPAATPDWGPRS